VTSPAAPASLTEIATRVETRLAAALDVEHARWAAIDASLAEPIAEIRRLVLAGGKRLRPAFCHWGFVGVGGADDDPAIVDMGAAFELMHAFALFHDDVMDDASSRRGDPTTHTVFAARHQAEGWAGEARRFGEGVAILVGDLAFVFADQLVTGMPPEVWRLWNELRVELNSGQYLDLIGSAQRERRRDRTERICRYKSGKYTIERPLQIGALMAAPHRAGELLPALGAYGLPLGDAFQMRDDVLGAFGDPSVTGKPVGADLREGKPTPLLSRAVDAATPAQRAVLDRVGDVHLDAAAIADIQQAIVDTGALDELERHIAALTDTAIEAIGRAPVTEPARRELIELAGYVSDRHV
jgi:geranylgeranyl diphosphate synthase type I